MKYFFAGLIVISILVSGVALRAGQRSVETNVYVARVFVIVDENITSTSILFSNDTVEEILGTGADLKKWKSNKCRKIVFCAKPDKNNPEQVKFKGYAEIFIDVRGKKSFNIEKGGRFHDMSKLWCVYKDKNGKEYETRAIMTPTIITK